MKSTNTAADYLPVPSASNIDEAHKAYCKMLTDAAKKHIPCKVLKNHVPSWDEECEDFLRAPNKAKTNVDTAKTATDLMTRLNTKQRERWTATVETIDFTHSSRWVWQTINKLTGQASKPRPCPITANAIAAQLINNGRFLEADKSFTRKISGKVNDLHRAPRADSNLQQDEEFSR